MSFGTYAFVGYVGEDGWHILGPVSSLTTDEDLGTLRDGILDVLTDQHSSRDAKNLR